MIVVSSPAYSGDDTAPALLQFAEHYQNQKEQTITSPVKARTSRAVPKSSEVLKKRQVAADSSSSLRTKDEQLQRQQRDISLLQHQLSIAGNQQPANKLSLTNSDISQGIAQVILGIKKGLRPSLEQKRITKLISKLKQDRSQALANVDDAKREIETLTRQLNEWQVKNSDALSVAKDDCEKVQSSLTAKWQVAQQQQQIIAQQLAEKNNSLAHQSQALQALKDQLSLLQPATTISTDQQKLSYAAGVALGKNVLEVQSENASIGVSTDKKLLLAGIVDSFSGHFKLAADVLSATLLESDKQLSAAREKQLSEQKLTSKSYLSTFKNQKDVHKSESGFWYHIDYLGDDKIPADSVYKIVVQESLTDGTMIQDMEANGSILSQKLDHYPPLFREALSKLNNHGSITLVVPPELAYGDKGYPPKIPPNSTMVYVVRIVEANAEK